MEDYSELIQQVIEVDDNNDPAPKNTPQKNNTKKTAEQHWIGMEQKALYDQNW